MEATPSQRAAVRLALVGSGVLAIVMLLAATFFVVSRRGESAAAKARPEWDVIETSESYQLPITPVAAMPVSEAIDHFGPTAPTYVEPPESSVAAARPVAMPTLDTTEWSGPQTIHNPAAFGPPEDDSLPPIPTRRAPAEQRVATLSTPVMAPRLIAAKPPRHWSKPAIVARKASPESEPFDMAIGETFDEPFNDESDLDAVATHNPRTKTPTRPLRDLSPADEQGLLSYTASTNDLSRRLTPEVQAGFQLGKSGAVFAARAKFVGVLRRIAQAKDAEARSTRHAVALAEGLRTLDQADDFVPKGDALEAELNVAAIARSHGVRIIDDEQAVTPHDAMARYSQHAAKCLAEAAAKEPAGSMALYGLGKSYTRLEAQGDDPTAGRKSAVLYRAAIDTRAENYLAANELGVRLARVGRYDQASAVLRQAASQPTAIATVHANLAAIEQRRGEMQVAAAAQQHSQMLAEHERAAGDVSRRHGIEWVAPDAFQRPGQRTIAAAPPNTAPLQQQPIAEPVPQEPGGWSGMMRTAKRMTGWSSPEPTSTYSNQPLPVAVPQQRVLR